MNVWERLTEREALELRILQREVSAWVDECTVLRAAGRPVNDLMRPSDARLQRWDELSTKLWTRPLARRPWWSKLLWWMR